MAKHKLLDVITGTNFHRIIKIRYTRSASGKYVLYLEHYQKGSREKFYPGLFLTLDPKERSQDERSLRIIMSLRDEREIALADGRQSGDTGFIDYATAIAATKNRSQKDMILGALSHWEKLFPYLNLSDLQTKHADKYLDSLSGLSDCTREHYVRVLHYVCNKAVRSKLLRESPFADIRIRVKPPKRNYLTESEIRKVMESTCPTIDVRNAFLFSCFTGLRYGDIAELSPRNIQGDILEIKVRKTGSYERLKIPSVAMQYLRMDMDKCFALPTYKYVRSNLTALMLNAGISKKITFHCARHTFATLQLSLGTDIYTVSKLLGHSDVRVTQIYAKLLDKSKDQAMDRLATALKADPKASDN